MPQKELDNMGSTNDRKFIFGFITFTCSVLLFYHFNPQITKEMYVKTARARKTFELREFKDPTWVCGFGSIESPKLRTFIFWLIKLLTIILSWRTFRRNKFYWGRVFKIFGPLSWGMCFETLKSFR